MRSHMPTCDFWCGGPPVRSGPSGRTVSPAALLATAILLLAPLVAPAQRTARRPVDRHTEIQYPPLNPIRIPEVDKYTLPNGMTVFLVEDHELPVIRAQALIRTGQRLEPPDKAGLAGIMATVMRTGGSKTRKGDSIDEELDRLGASMETGMGLGNGSASMFSLKEDFDKVFEVMADVLRDPAFPEDKIELAKIDVRDSISRRNDQPMSIAFRERRRLLYGRESPYARQPEYATVDAITRQDLIDFHKKYYQPENIILGVWGDFHKARMKERVAKVFGAWPKGGQPKPETPPVDRSLAAKPGLYLINKEDVNQSNISLSLLVGKISDPDYFALTVMNEILGGGFGSRITDEVRTRLGLAYSAGSAYAPGYDYPGPWSGQAGTKSESTIQAIRAIREQVEKIRAEGVTAEELQRAKDRILKSEAFDYDSTGKIISRLMTYEYYGYPSDFLERFRANIEKVTRQDVQRAAQKHLLPEQFVVLVLGNAKNFEQPLSSLGTVTEVDISIPPPAGSQVTEGSPEAEDKGKALLAKAREAHGGAALSAVKQYRLKGDMSVSTPQGEMDMSTDSTVNLAPARRISKMSAPMGEITQGFDGASAWVAMGGQVREAPGSQTEAAKQAAARENLLILQRFDQNGYHVQALGPQQLEGKQVEAVLVNHPAENMSVRFFVDPATGLLAGRSYVGSFGGPPAELTEVFSDYREVAGVKLPFAVVITRQGQKIGSVKVSEIVINPNVPDSAFAKPQ
jgi:zinc protease